MANKRTNIRSHAQLLDQANAAADGEFFDFNVSDSDSELEGVGAPGPARQPRKRVQDAPEIDQPLNINDPTPAQDSKRAADIHHFFERQEDKNVCRVCK